MLTFPPRNALLEAFQESSLLRLGVLMNHFGSGCTTHRVNLVNVLGMFHGFNICFNCLGKS